jgi:hypothetical protein
VAGAWRLRMPEMLQRRTPHLQDFCSGGASVRPPECGRSLMWRIRGFRRALLCCKRVNACQAWREALAGARRSAAPSYCGTRHLLYNACAIYRGLGALCSMSDMCRYACQQHAVCCVDWHGSRWLCSCWMSCRCWLRPLTSSHRNARTVSSPFCNRVSLSVNLCR